MDTYTFTESEARAVTLTHLRGSCGNLTSTLHRRLHRERGLLYDSYHWNSLTVVQELIEKSNDNYGELADHGVAGQRNPQHNFVEAIRPTTNIATTTISDMLPPLSSGLPNHLADVGGGPCG